MRAPCSAGPGRFTRHEDTARHVDEAFASNSADMGEFHDEYKRCPGAMSERTIVSSTLKARRKGSRSAKVEEKKEARRE